MRKTIAKLCAIALALLCFLSPTIAQNGTVSGTISDQNGAGIQGVTVTVRGTSNATQTDAQGRYTINAPGNSILVLSSVGFGTKEVRVNGQSTVNSSLSTQGSNLNEVVVVGYGTRRVKDATGSVAAITPKDFNKGVISTPEQLLQGRTPGVIVSPSSGEPGAAATINIRGTASIRGNQEPLYVVDGVPISPGGTSGTASGVEGSSTPKNPLAFLNPNDIESISILKDASSAAIYGSRGANGVIIITTKGGRSPRGAFTFNATTSVAWPAAKYDLLNAGDFLAAVKKANIAAGTSPEAAAEAVKVVDKGYSTNWQDQVLRTSLSQSYNLGWGIGRKNTSVRLSGSYDDQQGIIKNSSLKRLTGRANLSQKFLNDKLRLDVNATYSNVKNQYPPLTNNAGYQGSLVGAYIAFNPTYPIYNPDGSFYDPADGNRNPVEMLAYFHDNDNINRFLTNVSGTWQIIEGLSYKATFGYDDSKSERLSFADPRLSTGSFSGTSNVFGVDLKNPIQYNGRGAKQNLELKSLLVEHTLTYDKTFATVHAINAVVGYSFQRTETDFSGKYAWGLQDSITKPGDQFALNFNSFKNYYNWVPGYGRNDLQSYFGRLNYTYNDKYLLTATFRADGSSKFGKNNRYGYFPAFAAKWRLLKEDFLNKPLGNFFNDLSLRVNYGILGSQEGLEDLGAVQLQQRYRSAPIDQPTDTTTTVQNRHEANPDLKWEQAATTGVGLDYAFFNNRLSGTVDYYYTKRKNLLFQGPTPGGFASANTWFINLPGFVINKGLEFSLNAGIIRTKKFSWDLNYNMTFIHNELRDFNLIVNTGGVSGQGLTGAYAQTFANGYPLFTWKMPTFEGFDGNGNARYANGGKDQLQGSALPKFLGGLTNSFTLGRWNASIFFNTVRGFYVYNNTANALFVAGSVKTAHNVTYSVYNSNENSINPGSVSTRFLEKGDFIRLSNATLSYAFDMHGKIIHSLSVNVTGQNLALWTKYSGLDPEVNVDKNINGVPSRGFDYTGYPKPRTVTFGLNLGF